MQEYAQMFMSALSSDDGSGAPSGGSGGMYSAESSINVSTGGVDLGGVSMAGTTPIILAGVVGLVLGFMVAKL